MTSEDVIGLLRTDLSRVYGFVVERVVLLGTRRDVENGM